MNPLIQRSNTTGFSNIALGLAAGANLTTVQ
jgi:hypothetical protein